MLDPDLTDAEVDRICDGLKQNAAKVRYLRSLGVTVTRKPSGRALVSRAHYIAVRGAPPAPAGRGVSSAALSPNWSRPR
jgi:hypothetical protein